MAQTAILSSGQMVGVFAASGNTIVTGSTIIDDAGMIKHPIGKTGDAMADAAIFAGGDVRR